MGVAGTGIRGLLHVRRPRKNARRRSGKFRRRKRPSPSWCANGITPPDEQARSLLEAGNADQLTPAQAKAYLKLHACACSGTKAELIQRCKKFMDLQDGRAHALYPRSGFSQPIVSMEELNKDDVVLFKQKLWEGHPSICIGDRWVAGRVTAAPNPDEPQGLRFL
jgi:hypothetical protein